MKKICLLLLIGCLSIASFGQINISTKLTEDHKKVEGTKISLVPPKDFTKADNFLGFQQTKSGSSIMVLNIPGSFSKVSPGFTKKGLLTQGVEASKIEKITLNSIPGMFVTAEQSAYGNVYTKYILAFGTEKETILINGIFPKKQSELNEDMKNAVLSTVYALNEKINPFDVVDFKIDTTGTGLIFASNVSNSLLFNRDGKMPSESKDKAYLLVTKSFSTVTIVDKKVFAEQRIEQLPMDIDKIISNNPITIDGIAGYEIIADVKDRKNEVKKKVYQVLLFTDSLYYMFFGSSEADFDKNIVLFKNFVETFEQKNKK